MPHPIRDRAVTRSQWPRPVQHRVCGCNLGHVGERRPPCGNLSQASGPNNTRRIGALPYLPGHDPEGIHIIGHRGVHAVCKVLRHHRRSQFQCAGGGKSVCAGLTLRCPRCRVGKNGRVAETGYPGSAVFIGQDVYLRREVDVDVNSVT